jgi:hypothetical protein
MLKLKCAKEGSAGQILGPVAVAFDAGTDVCLTCPEQLQFANCFRVTFPAMRGFFALIAFAIGISIMNHEIIDCIELRGACEAYRMNNWDDCKPPMVNPLADCSCLKAIDECYESRVDAFGIKHCVSCDTVAQNYIQVLKSTGGIVVTCGSMLFILAWIQHLAARIDRLVLPALGFFVCCDIGMIIFLIVVFGQKMDIAHTIGEVCHAETVEEAYEYAPLTMDNLCDYQGMVSWIAAFAFILIVITSATCMYSCFGCIAGVPAAYGKQEDTGLANAEVVGNPKKNGVNGHTINIEVSA